MTTALQIHGLIEHNMLPMNDNTADQALDAICEALEQWGFTLTTSSKLVNTSMSADDETTTA